MFGLLMIFGQIRAEAWYGKNAGLMESLPTGLRHVELTWRHLLSVPRPIAAQRYSRAALNLVDKPQRACRCHDQTKRVGAEDALPRATLVLPRPIAGITVTDSP